MNHLPTVQSNRANASVKDAYGRELRELRISVTDRCNMRCGYCMPRERFGPEHAFLPRSALLTFEEIERVARLFVNLGVTKIRLTGGEPLLRRDLVRLVRMLRTLGQVELAMTTNGHRLAKMASQLAAAGLTRVTVSLDAIDPRTFAESSGVGARVDAILDAIDAARDAGLDPIKINAVIRRGVNDGEIVPLAERFRGTGHVLRFIEYMDVGETNRWRLDDVVTAEEILSALGTQYELQPVQTERSDSVANYWRYADGAGEIGVVASVTRPFCRGCTRARLSADGKIFSCLFASRGRDLRSKIRDGADDDTLLAEILETWTARNDRYSESRAVGARERRKIEMSYIGG